MSRDRSSGMRLSHPQHAGASLIALCRSSLGRTRRAVALGASGSPLAPEAAAAEVPEKGKDDEHDDDDPDQVRHGTLL
jgi:hypothetical protein